MTRVRKRQARATIPSAAVPFIRVETDGRRKDRHNREVMRVLGDLRARGVTHYNLHHVDDGGLDKSVPLNLKGKQYDIGYVAEDGEVFLIEVMRVTYYGAGDLN